MSGSIDYTQLLPQDAASSIGASLLQALYGSTNSSADSPAGALSALTAAERDQERDIAATAKQPQVARDIAAFQAGLAKATTPQELLANPAVLKVLLTANGLGDQIPYTALATKALLSDPADPKSLVNQLTNPAWKSTAATYQFATAGLAVINQPAVQQTIANAYAEITWRQSLDDAHPGLSHALSFRDSAAHITTVDQILGDPVLRDVVTTALGLPLQIALQPLEAQEKAISSRLDITRFADPKFTENFIQRYLIAKATGGTSSGLFV